LLLKRANPPLIWGPPGGKLKINENPVDGLKREVYEETGFVIKILLPVTTWFGKFNNRNILSIDYLCQYEAGQIKLSDEHEKYKWLSIKDLEDNQNLYFNLSNGFQFKDYCFAWNVYQKIDT
jgi:ADP-ribose pyrophosphatase YjhB (NUDIX family)